jgi:hypothetical protein
MSRSPCTVARSILLASTALLFAVMPPAFAQTSADVGAVLRAVAGHFPELTPALVRQSMPPGQHSWSAISPILYISVEVTGSTEEAESKLRRSFVFVSVANDREEVFNGKALYVWERYGMRLSYQTGPYVIHISNRDGDPRVGINEPLAMNVLGRLVRELESVAP